jgi:hypothetical protein
MRTTSGCLPSSPRSTRQPSLAPLRSTRRYNIWNKDRRQRPILNFAPRGKLCPQGRSCPPGVNFVPWGLINHLGVKFSVRPSILLNSRVFTPGVNEGVNIHPREQISPLGAKFTLRGEVLSWETGVKLRMALSRLAQRSRVT